MHAIDLRNMSIFLLEDDRKIPKEHLHSMCKFKCGANTCRYIALTVKGYVCSKKTPIKKVIDKRVEEKKSNACGDNCYGLGKEKGRENG